MVIIHYKLKKSLLEINFEIKYKLKKVSYFKMVYLKKLFVMWEMSRDICH